MSITLRLVFAAAFLSIVFDGSTANAQYGRRPQRGGNYSALNNQMLGMFYANQQRNWALVNNGRTSAPTYRGVRTANPFSGATVRTPPTAPSYSRSSESTYSGVRTVNPFNGTTVRTPPTAPNYSTGNRGKWYNPYNEGRDNNVYGPSPYNGKSRYFYDPNARKSSR